MAGLGQLIRQHRYASGWTQDDLARRLGGTNQTAISQWENGRDTWASWNRFDDLVGIFEYPEDMIICWSERQQGEIDRMRAKAQLYRDHASSRTRPKMIASLDRLIAQSQVMQAELATLRRQVEQMTEGESAGTG